MRAKDVKTPKEIFEYVRDTGPDEFEESLDGLYRYYKYATDKQRAIIEQWVLEDWDRTKDEFISYEEGCYMTFDGVGLYEHFICDHIKYCKISETEAAKVFTTEIIKFDGDTEVGTD